MSDLIRTMADMYVNGKEFSPDRREKERKVVTLYFDHFEYDVFMDMVRRRGTSAGEAIETVLQELERRERDERMTDMSAMTPDRRRKLAEHYERRAARMREEARHAEDSAG